MTCDECGAEVANDHGLAVHRGRRHGGSPHGTPGRYQRGCHCPECTEANRLANVRWRRSRGVRPQPVARCGTEAGYQRHYYLGEPACRPCLDAHAAHFRRVRRERRRRARRGPVWSVICDYLETFGPQQREALVALIRQRHDDIPVVTIRRELDRLRTHRLVEPTDRGWRLVVDDWLERRLTWRKAATP